MLTVASPFLVSEPGLSQARERLAHEREAIRLRGAAEGAAREKARAEDRLKLMHHVNSPKLTGRGPQNCSPKAGHFRNLWLSSPKSEAVGPRT